MVEEMLPFVQAAAGPVLVASMCVLRRDPLVIEASLLFVTTTVASPFESVVQLAEGVMTEAALPPGFTKSSEVNVTGALAAPTELSVSEALTLGLGVVPVGIVQGADSVQVAFGLTETRESL